MTRRQSPGRSTAWYPPSTRQTRRPARHQSLELDKLDPADVLEKQWQAHVVRTATELGWRHYHTFDSRRSAAGYPDLTLVKPPRTIFAELKREGANPTDDQIVWLRAFAACGAEVYIWRPSDRDRVDRILASRRRP